MTVDEARSVLLAIREAYIARKPTQVGVIYAEAISLVLTDNDANTFRMKALQAELANERRTTQAQAELIAQLKRSRTVTK